MGASWDVLWGRTKVYLGLAEPDEVTRDGPMWPATVVALVVLGLLVVVVLAALLAGSVD